MKYKLITTQEGKKKVAFRYSVNDRFTVRETFRDKSVKVYCRMDDGAIVGAGSVAAPDAPPKKKAFPVSAIKSAADHLLNFGGAK